MPLIDEKGLAEARKSWDNFKSELLLWSLLDTLDTLWRIARAGQEHCRTHGHTTDNTLEDALIDAGLLDPAMAFWRKKAKPAKGKSCNA